MNKVVIPILFGILFFGTFGLNNVYAAPGDFIDVFTSGGGTVNSGFTFGPDGKLYGIDGFGNTVFRYDGAGVLEGAFVSAGLGSPFDVVFGPNGDLYVSNALTAQSNVLRYDNNGQLIGGFSGGGLSSPHGLSFGPDGHLYVGSADTNQVLRYNINTGLFIDVFASGGAEALTFGPDGNLYVLDDFGRQVLRFDSVTGDPLPAPGQFGAVFIPQGSGGLLVPRGFTFGPNGNLYVSDEIGNKVLRYNGATGAFIDEFVIVGNEVPLGNLFDLTFGPDGNLYVNTGGQVLRYEALFDDDGDGFLTDVDCNDLDSTIFPGAFENPGDNIDQSCDGSDGILSCGSGTILAGDECVPSGATLSCGLNTFESGGVCLPVAALAFCGDHTEEILGFCVPILLELCSTGTMIDMGVCTAQAMGSMIGGVLMDIDTTALLVGAIGTNPVITGLVAITLAGVAGQAVWFVHRRKKSK